MAAGTPRQPESFSVLATLGIALVLGLPFVARALSAQLEPYPAVLLPAGAGWIEAGSKQLRFGQLKLWGRCGGESWRELDSERFMHPIPVHYLGGIEQRNFGLDAPDHLRLTLKMLGDVVVARPKPTAAAVAETKQWLGRRLTAHGCSPKALRVTREVRLVEIPSGRVTALARALPEVIHELD